MSYTVHCRGLVKWLDRKSIANHCLWAVTIWYGSLEIKFTSRVVLNYLDKGMASVKKHLNNWVKSSDCKRSDKEAEGSGHYVIDI